jgi:hypothetical protein
MILLLLTVHIFHDEYNNNYLRYHDLNNNLLQVIGKTIGIRLSVIANL